MGKNEIRGTPTIAAVVVLYNPDTEVLDNMDSYGDGVDKIYCVDNSENRNDFISRINKVTYIPLYNNMGVAHALNIGCRRAVKDGTDFIITFDQDTVCDKNTIYQLIKKLDQSAFATVVSPNVKYIYREKNRKRIFSDEVMWNNHDKFVPWCITSGSVFRSQFFDKTGGYDDKLFIGQVDFDFCFRVYKAGGNVYRMGNVYIYQEPGSTIRKKLFYRYVHVPNLTAKRYYYLFRNEIYLRKKWGEEYRNYYVDRYKYVISILLFEKEKTKKIIACLKGYIDGIRMDK